MIGYSVINIAHKTYKYFLIILNIFYQDGSENFKLPLFSSYPPPKEYLCGVALKSSVKQGHYFYYLLKFYMKLN